MLNKMDPSESRSVAGKWLGQFTYGYSHQMRSFSFDLQETGDGAFKGHMLDDKHADMGDVIGSFARSLFILRRHSTDRSWLRVYEPIEFQGKLSNDGKKLSGGWTNTNNSGSWKAERVGYPPQDAELKEGEADFDQVAGVTDSPFQDADSPAKVSLDLSFGLNDVKSRANPAQAADGKFSVASSLLSKANMSDVNPSPIDQKAVTALLGPYTADQNPLNVDTFKPEPVVPSAIEPDGYIPDPIIAQYSDSAPALGEVFAPDPSADAPPIPSFFNTGLDRSNAPSISTDTISSDSVKSLNIIAPATNANDFLQQPPIALPTPTTASPSPSVPEPSTSKASTASGTLLICSRCGAPKGDFNFCLGCGHSFELSQ